MRLAFAKGIWAFCSFCFGRGGVEKSESKVLRHYKKKLKEYISLFADEKELIWEKGVFVLDVNVLLNMCRFSKQSCNELLGIIKKHKVNLWLPYQVATEFFNNRLAVIEGVRKNFDALLANVSKTSDILEKELNFKDFRPDTANLTVDGF